MLHRRHADRSIVDGPRSVLAVWLDDPRGQMWVRKNLHFGEPIDDDASGIVLELI